MATTPYNVTNYMERFMAFRKGDEFYSRIMHGGKCVYNLLDSMNRWEPGLADLCNENPEILKYILKDKSIIKTLLEIKDTYPWMIKYIAIYPDLIYSLNGEKTCWLNFDMPAASKISTDILIENNYTFELNCRLLGGSSNQNNLISSTNATIYTNGTYGFVVNYNGKTTAAYGGYSSYIPATKIYEYIIKLYPGSLYLNSNKVLSFTPSSSSTNNNLTIGNTDSSHKISFNYIKIYDSSSTLISRLVPYKDENDNCGFIETVKKEDGQSFYWNKNENNKQSISIE